MGRNKSPIPCFKGTGLLEPLPPILMRIFVFWSTEALSLRRDPEPRVDHYLVILFPDWATINCTCTSGLPAITMVWVPVQSGFTE